MRRTGFGVAIATLGVAQVAWAQNGTVTGTVTAAENGQPVLGAQVVLVGTQRGSATREDGQYTITVPPGTYRMRVARIGFQPDTATVVVGAGATVRRDFRLQSATLTLTAVVTQAYSTQATERRNVTGSVAAVDTALFNKGRVVSAEDLIQAKVPGVQVVSSNEPGGGIQVRVRGQASINGAKDPLFVVDGVPLPIGGGLSGGRNPLNFLNPADIANITVLKDAQATAIYGSRGANGVVLVTTKNGSSGGPQITYGTNISSRSVAKAPEYLNASQFAAAVRQYAPNNAKLLQNNSTDWLDALEQNGGGQEHNLSVAGTRQDLQYRLSLGYLTDEGVLLGDRTQRTSGQLTYSDRLFGNTAEVQASLRGARTKDVLSGGRFLNGALLSAPTNPIYNGDGTYFATANVLEPRNPLAQRDASSNTGLTDRALGNLQARVNLPWVSGLSATVRGSFDAARTNQRTFTGRTDPGQAFANDTLRGSFYLNTPDATTLVLDAFGNYTRRLEQFATDLDLTGGYSYEAFRANNSSFTVTGLNSDALGASGIPSARQISTPSVNVQESRLASFFGRANLTISDRYLLGVSVRRDGSSRFGSNNQWGTFPAVSLGWRLSDESVLKGRLGPLNDVKLRYSYGVNGNQPTTFYTSYATYTYSIPFNQVQFGNQFIPTVQPSVANPNLRWEQSKTHDVGLDYSAWDGRVSGTVDYYNKLTTDLLFEATVPGGSNFNNRLLQNIGSLRNAGVELGLNLAVLRGRGTGMLGRLRWDANFNAATNRNKLLAISTTAGQVSEILNGQIGLGGDYVQTLRPGLPINTFRVLKVKRDASGTPVTGPQTALNTTYYVDQNADGKIDNSDLVPFHNPAPRWVLGHTSNFGLGKADLSFTLRSYLGYWVYNGAAAQQGTFSQLQQGDVLRNLNALVYKYNFVNPQFNSEVYVEKADFLRMDNVTLGYALPKLGALRSTRVFATVQNVFTTTKYSGVDPLAALQSYSGSEAGRPALSGIDNNAYPLSRIVTLGLTLGF